MQAGKIMQVRTPIDFYFDFSSPYGFLAAQKIDALGALHGREVEWHPILLGVVFKETGSLPLTEIPLKGVYSKRDFARSARFHGLPPITMPSRFPIPTQLPARLVLWLKQTAPERVTSACLALFRAYFERNLDISEADNAIAVVAQIGVDDKAARAASVDPAIKDALKQSMARALERGVFGSPFFIVDDEPFWGLDRLEQLDRWLRTGGF